MNANNTFPTAGPAQMDSPTNMAGGASEPLMAGQEARQQYRANNSRLPADAWKDLDSLMVDVAQERLNLVDRLRAAGLIDPVDIGTTITTWQETNAFDEADVSMDGRSESDEDSSVYAEKGAPVPLVTKGFRVGHRQQNSQPNVFDTNADKATRQVVEKMEDMIINGWSFDVSDADNDTYSLDGLATDANVNSYTGSTWGTASNIEDDVRTAIDTAEGDNYYGPYDLWVGGQQWGYLRQPSADFDNMRVRTQLEDNNLGLAQIDQISVSDKIPDGEAFLVQLTSDVLDAKLVNGNLTDAVEWDNTPMETQVKVFSGFAPRVKSDMGQDGSRQSGVVHLTGLS